MIGAIPKCEKCRKRDATVVERGFYYCAKCALKQQVQTINPSKTINMRKRKNSKKRLKKNNNKKMKPSLKST